MESASLPRQPLLNSRRNQRTQRRGVKVLTRVRDDDGTLSNPKNGGAYQSRHSASSGQVKGRMRMNTHGRFQLVERSRHCVVFRKCFANTNIFCFVPRQSRKQLIQYVDYSLYINDRYPSPNFFLAAPLLALAIPYRHSSQQPADLRLPGAPYLPSPLPPLPRGRALVISTLTANSEQRGG